MSSLDAIAVITVKLFAIIDPFSVLPYLLAVYEEAIKEGSDKKVSWNFIVNKITIAIIILLIIFSVLGRPLLDFLGISPQALEIAGGILLVYLGVVSNN